MRRVGDYEWRQLSMWDFSPDECVEKYVKSNGNDVFHYYLVRIIEIIADNRWKVETVKSIDGVPEDVLCWRNDNWIVKGE